MLLDVIMETDVAGLELVEYIRNELKNETVRIILRTGQPGQAPERRVIVQYDINDYKAKTELTADKLFTSLTAALRSYQQLERMVQTRRGLEIIIDAASTLYDFKSMQRLAEGVLTQLASLLNVDCAGILVLRDDGAAGERFLGAGGLGLLQPLHRHHRAPSRSIRICGRWWKPPSSAARTNSPTTAACSICAPAAAAKWWCCCRPSASFPTPTARWSRFSRSRLSIAFDNVILYQQLHEANTQLEDRVAQRTRALMQANRRLSAQWLRLQRANGFKNEILGTVAHDLKNPLGVILGRTEMLTELIGAGSPKENVTAQVEHIRDATKRLTSMVDHLISDAMADAFDITIRREPVDVAALVSEVADANLPSAVNKQQTITRVRAAEFRHHVRRRPDARGDRQSRQQRHQIFSRSAARSRWSSPMRGSNTVIRIADEGAGLSPEDLGRLFGRFQRLSAKPTAGESSTGLGLSIVKRIIDMHGGHVTAESAGPGQGSTFTVTLPATETYMTQSPHIIIVDDEAPAREMVGDYLKMHGFTRDAVRRRQEPARRDRDQRARSRRARPQHARGRRAFDHPRPEEPHQRPRHHADGDRKPDRPRRRPRTRRRRLHRKALRTARIDGAHPLGAAPERAGQGRLPRRKPAAAKAEKEQLVRFGTKWLDLEAQALRDDEGNEHPLTASEFGLLKVFAANPKRVLSRERLLELANARDAEAFDRAVDLRIMRIRRKIEIDPTKPAVIRTIRGGGYLFSPTGDKG